MERVWTITPITEPSPTLKEEVSGHLLIAQILTQRGFDTPQKARKFLDPAHYTPALPTALLGVAEAAELLYHAVEQQKNILVWGDFDVDGQTSTSLLVAGLLKLTASERVRFHVPNRFAESHGIRPDFLKPWLEDPDWQPDLLLTCDTGIAETEGIALAKAHGLTVVVTDHHDLTAEFMGLAPGIDPLWGLPMPDSVQSIITSSTDDKSINTQTIVSQADDSKAQCSVRWSDAIVNPKFQSPDDPLRTLPGVGVAYKLIQELYRLADCSGEEEELLDLVALGIVADVAEQVHDARYLLQLGLKQLRKTQRAGLLALMNVSRITPESVNAESIGFQLGPRMNALGRLEDATVAVELLTTQDAIRAGQLAAKMERLNQERRQLTQQITNVAKEMIERDPGLLNYNGLVLSHPGWHAGIVGIVASRLVEEYNRPTVLLLNPPGEPARGSARSIQGVDIGASIAACNHLLLNHGGHPDAAGLSLLPENINAFRRELDRQIELHRTEDEPPSLAIDAVLPLEKVTMSLAEDLQRLAPFGNGNPTPQFMSQNLRIVNDRKLGQNGTHRRLTVQQAESSVALPVIWFNGGQSMLPSEPLDLVYTLDINEFRDERSLQLTYVATRASEEISIQVGATSRETTQGSLQILDLRHQTIEPSDLPKQEEALWYAEGIYLPTAQSNRTQNNETNQFGAKKDDVQGGMIIPNAISSINVTYSPRTGLTTAQPGQPLIIWSILPDPTLLHEILKQIQPNILYLCGKKTTNDSVTNVLQSIAGMCKHAMNRDNTFSIQRAAARLGMTEQIIRLGLQWLIAKGLIRTTDVQTVEQVFLMQGTQEENSERTAQLQTELERSLDEIRAYRRFFLRTKIDGLIQLDKIK